MDASDIHVFTYRISAPPSAEIYHVKLGDVLEIIDEIIIFDFLPHCSFLSMHISSAMTYFITTESQASLVVG